jgi:signal transduction histidine kinase
MLYPIPEQVNDQTSNGFEREKTALGLPTTIEQLLAIDIQPDNQYSIPGYLLIELFSQLNEAGRLSDLIHVTAHNAKAALGTPLFALQHTSANLDTEEHAFFTEAIQSLKYISNLMDYLRNNGEVNMERLEDPKSLIRISLDAVKFDPDFSDIKFISTSSDPDSSISIRVNSTLFVGSLKNIIRNAAEAIRYRIDESPSIRRENIVTVELFGGDGVAEIIILITDTGNGIESERLDSILTTRNKTTKPNGSGIGLSSAYQMVRSLNGSMRVTSITSKDNPHECGTSIAIIIPIARSTAD